MAKPEIYVPEEGREQQKPTPKVYLDVTGEEITVIAVDNNGKFLANLFNQKRAFPNVKQVLEEEGHSTAWAEWDVEGVFLRLKK